MNARYIVAFAGHIPFPLKVEWQPEGKLSAISETYWPAIGLLVFFLPDSTQVHAMTR